ncbi:hypothetical protein KP509_32G067300 [Ceratopteris richardii]|uniref:3'-5' exonuclease domain-containing protein n=1 Tax=Ceratopteris richardii TaxID=49495 RepID=A0A8T2QW23_CERRI|nr:hypothetical protein KP509_32G067300 [Ceratopteris richardii]
MEPWPLPRDCIHFVDSAHSESFALLLQALDRAYIVAMDAEWKPVRSNNRRRFPRVSIMQLACRLSNCIAEPRIHDGDAAGSEDTSHGEAETSTDLVEQPVKIRNATAGQTANLNSQGPSSYENCMNLSAEQSTVCNRQEGHNHLELSQSRVQENEEIIFLLDMMSIPISFLWEAMKKMLVSSTVVKLGFKFKQDLVNLARSFPEPDSHSCFDKVDPYIDIGKLFLELCGSDGTCLNTLSLATICEEVVGYTLCKDLQCSNWEQRPLTNEQQLYAAADAHCLLLAYDVLKNKTSKGDTDYSSCTSTEDGVGAILQYSLGFAGNLEENVLHANRGVATAMVRAAIASRILVTTDLCTDSFFAPHTLLIEKYGERLLVSDEVTKKSTKKKQKRVQVKREPNVARHIFCGPPPWDPSCGGDGTPKFICDCMVGGLAKHLRNVGFDTVSFHKKVDPRKLVELAEKEHRVLLTQDVKLLGRGFMPATHAYHVKSKGKEEQLFEVVRRFGLEILEENLLSRCTKCNGEFFPNSLTPDEALAAFPVGQTLPRQDIIEQLVFWQCSKCMHMYWQVSCHLNISTGREAKFDSVFGSVSTPLHTHTHLSLSLSLSLSLVREFMKRVIRS